MGSDQECAQKQDFHSLGHQRIFDAIWKLQHANLSTDVAVFSSTFLEIYGEKIGNIAAGGLLTFFLEEIGPVVYNQEPHHVQERMMTRISELDIEVHEYELQYRSKIDSKKGPANKRVDWPHDDC